MNDMVNMISTIGFPIFACVYMMKNNEKFVEVLGEISNNLTLLNERISQLEDKLNEQE